jgi:hypothetical protein
MNTTLLPLRVEDNRQLLATKSLWLALVTAPDPRPVDEVLWSAMNAVAAGGAFLIVGGGAHDEDVYRRLDRLMEVTELQADVDRARAAAGVPPLPEA